MEVNIQCGITSN